MKRLLFLLPLFLGCSLAIKEAGPTALLKKYEWFKDAAAAIDSKRASLEVYKGRKKALVESYGGRPRHEWAREDREAWNLWEQEIAGLIDSHNDLASLFNSNMAKENYRFCEQGRLPEGASKPLPREFKPYIEE